MAQVSPLRTQQAADGRPGNELEALTTTRADRKSRFGRISQNPPRQPPTYLIGRGKSPGS